MFTIRFDMRAPSSGAPASGLYAAAIDNHLPSPIVPARQTWHGMARPYPARAAEAAARTG